MTWDKKYSRRNMETELATRLHSCPCRVCLSALNDLPTTGLQLPTLAALTHQCRQRSHGAGLGQHEMSLRGDRPYLGPSGQQKRQENPDRNCSLYEAAAAGVGTCPLRSGGVSFVKTPPAAVTALSHPQSYSWVLRVKTGSHSSVPQL